MIASSDERVSVWQTLRFLQQRDGAAESDRVVRGRRTSQRSSSPRLPGPGYFSTDPGAVGGVSGSRPGLAPTPESPCLIDPTTRDASRRLVALSSRPGVSVSDVPRTVAILDRADLHRQHQATTPAGTRRDLRRLHRGRQPVLGAIRTAIPSRSGETASDEPRFRGVLDPRFAATLPKGRSRSDHGRVRTRSSRGSLAPAIAGARALGLRSKLALATDYDSHVQSGPAASRGSGRCSRSVRRRTAARSLGRGLPRAQKWLETFKSTKTSADPTTQRTSAPTWSAVTPRPTGCAGSGRRSGRWGLPPRQFGRRPSA